MSVEIQVPPARVPGRGPSPWRALALMVVALLAAVGFALLGRHPSSPSLPPLATMPRVAAATASTSPAPRPTSPPGPDDDPAGTLSLAAVSASEAWATSYAGVPDGLWHYGNGGWSRVQVAGWPQATGIVALAVGPGGTLAADTDRGVAVLRDGRWTVLADVAMPMAMDAAGVVWLAEPGPGSRHWLVSSFRFDGTAWVREDLPAVPLSGISRLAVAGRRNVWAAEESEHGPGALAHFDGTRWTTVSLPAGFTTAGLSPLALSPSGDLWATVLSGPAPNWSWTVARYGRGGWRVFPPAASPLYPMHVLGTAFPINQSPLGFAPDGALLLCTTRGLGRFDGAKWTSVTTFDSGRRVVPVVVAAAPDGALWGWGPGGIEQIPTPPATEP